MKCNKCNGTGLIPRGAKRHLGLYYKDCPECKGTGKVKKEQTNNRREGEG